MTVYDSEQWASVMGDQGPWVKHLPSAWQAAASGGEGGYIPDRPAANARHDDVIAYWAPLLHLLVFGLGWSRPDVGLHRWIDMDAPTNDPLLRLVERWWGRDGVLDFLAWCASNRGIEVRLGPYRWDHQVELEPQRSPFRDGPEYERRRRTDDWQRVWGGGWDPMHLTHHLFGPMRPPDNFNPVPFDRTDVSVNHASAIPRLLVVSDTYAGWYSAFYHYMPGVGANGRSIRTDIVVKPVGWLGEFRRHTATGLWFRGRSAIHVWGQ